MCACVRMCVRRVCAYAYSEGVSRYVRVCTHTHTHTHTLTHTRAASLSLLLSLSYLSLSPTLSFFLALSLPLSPSLSLVSSSSFSLYSMWVSGQPPHKHLQALAETLSCLFSCALSDVHSLTLLFLGGFPDNYRMRTWQILLKLLDVTAV